MPAMSEATSVYFAHLTTERAQALADGASPPVLLWPLGATEPHGPHAPLATDLIIAEGLCRRVAEAMPGRGPRALVLPTLPFGVTRYANEFTGCVHVEESTLRAMIVDVARSLVGQRFRRIVAVNCHFEPDHVRTIHEALDAVSAELGVTVGYLDLTRRERAERLTEEFQRGESHADRYETSLVLAEQPELVDVERARSLPSVPVNMARAIAAGHTRFRAIGLERAYAGSPAEASAAEGEATFAVLAEMLTEVVLAVAAGSGGRDEPGVFGR